MASPLDEPPAVQIRRLQMENLCLLTENCRLQTENDFLRSENCRFRTENLDSLEKEEELVKSDLLRPENYYVPDETFLIELEKVAEKFPFSFDSAFLFEIEKRLEEEVEAIRGIQKDTATKKKDFEKKKSDDPDEKLAQLVEAGIAQDKAVEKMEDCMLYNKYLEERLGRSERALKVVYYRVRRMLERVKLMALDCDAGEAKVPEDEEKADEKWIRVLMRPLEEEMEKIESSFLARRHVRKTINFN